jgi:phosphoenolpyruvate carboxylase
MTNFPKTERSKNNFLVNQKKQISDLEITVRNIEENNSSLERKISNLRNQQDLNNKRKKEISLQISNIKQDSDRVEQSEINQNKEELKTSSIEELLQSRNYTLQDYQEGIIAPTVLRELGIPISQ